ncbi:MAG: hypothetical protein EON89_08240 [Brevundimonas sp.]|nr:MAG: hypothetical protein EON89_08240 [Brevundimonas sp.]
MKRVILVGVGGLAALLVLLTLVGAAIGYASAKGAIDASAGMPLVIGAFALLVMAGSFWIGVLWMRSIDEAAREAHKWAWYWGGTAGMAVGGVLMLLSAIPRRAPLQVPLAFGGVPDPAGYAATGAFGLMMIMTLGYSIAWAIWWWRHR